MIARITIAILVSLTISSSALAGTRPARVRLLIHGSLRMNKDITINSHFIPSANLIGPLSPIAYLGLGWQVSKHFHLEIAAGWSFGEMDEPILSLRPSGRFGKISFWGLMDLQPSAAGYWFIQSEFHPLKFLALGLEGEGWGSFTEGGWNIGFGPNLVLSMGPFEVNLSLHIRHDPKEGWRPEPVIRIHLGPF